LSYKAKPEANTAPFYLNTGSFDAKNASTFMLEAIKVQGPLSFIAEYMHNVVNSSGNGDPAFNYWTLGGSWFITGDNRKYNKNTGNLGKLLPKKAFTFKKGGGMGAFEVGARYTRSNLSDETIHGGTFRRFTGAFSWYPNAHFRFSVNYGKGNLDKDGLSGKSDFWQLRAQFEL
jgi:phosphate-selective porin OprO/OprP